MERLTYFNDGYWRVNFSGVQYQADFVDRLAAYEDTLTITLYAKLLRKKMDEGGITKEYAFHAGEMKASELWLKEVNHA